MLAAKIMKIRFRHYAVAIACAVIPVFAGCASTSGIPMNTSSCGACATDAGYGGGCSDGSCGMGCSDPMCAAPGGCTEGGCGTGCTDGGCGDGGFGGQCCEVPRELRKTSMPEYRIEPPDVLLIEASNHLRTATAPILAGEPLMIQVNRTLPSDKTDPSVAQQFKTINGMYVIGTDGYVNLGPEYGKVLCAGEPLNEVQRRVEVHLNRILKKPQVMVTLPDPTTKQIVAGPHLVRPDGTVGLGIYGDVYLAGMSMSEAKCEIERHLSSHMHAPEVSIDVLGYNSKFYYVIADGGGAGERVTRLPITGNETVLDAISQVSGLPSVACKGQIWIARPSPECCRPDQLLHVDWRGIAEGAQTCTNYQLLPGDRLYVKADRFVTFDTNFAKMTAPLERLLGFTILGNGTVRSLQRGSGQVGGGGF